MSKSNDYINLNLGKLLYDFEKKYFDEYKLYTIHNYSAWQILKGPLYFHLFNLLHSSSTESAPIRIKKSYGKLLFQKINYFTKFLFKFFWILLRSNKKNRVVLFGFAGDKHQRSEDNKLFNFLLDPFIEEKIVQNFIYFESSSTTIKNIGSVVKRDLETEGLELPISILSFIVKRKTFLSHTSTFFYNRLYDFFISYPSIQKNISVNFIKNVFSQFYAEYIIYKKVFKWIRPKGIIFSEQIGTGKMAVAQSRNIKTIELQHGVIDAYHPTYIYNQCMLTIQQQLILPTHIGIFGKVYRDVLLRNKFWSDDRIFLLGYYKMDSYKDISSKKNRLSSSIFFPLQWHVFDLSKKIMEQFAQSNFPFQLVIKSHPLEPSYQTDWYKEIASSYPSKIRYEEKTSSIYSLILNSDLVIGFESASLLETIALGVPCITIGTSSFPKGIHSLLELETLESSIRYVKTNEELIELIINYYKELEFRKKWNEEVKLHRSYLYEESYKENARRLIEKLLIKN